VASGLPPCRRASARRLDAKNSAISKYSTPFWSSAAPSESSAALTRTQTNDQLIQPIRDRHFAAPVVKALAPPGVKQNVCGIWAVLPADRLSGRSSRLQRRLRPRLATHNTCTLFRGILFFVGVYRNRLEILRLKDLPAIEAFHVIDTVPAGDDCCSFVLTGCSHTKTWGYELF